MNVPNAIKRVFSKNFFYRVGQQLTQQPRSPDHAKFKPENTMSTASSSSNEGGPKPPLFSLRDSLAASSGNKDELPKLPEPPPTSDSIFSPDEGQGPLVLPSAPLPPSGKWPQVPEPVAPVVKQQPDAPAPKAVALKPETPAPASKTIASKSTAKSEQETFLKFLWRAIKDFFKFLIAKILRPFVWAKKTLWKNPFSKGEKASEDKERDEDSSWSLTNLMPMIVIVSSAIILGVALTVLIGDYVQNTVEYRVSKVALSGFSNDQLDRIADRIAIDLNADAGINAKLAALTKQVDELKNKKVEQVNLDPVLAEIRKINEKVSEKLNENVKVDFGPVLAQIQKVQEKPVAAPAPAPTSSTTSSSLSAPTDSISDAKVVLKELQEIRSRLGGNQTFDFMLALSALEAKVNSLPKDIFDQSFVGSNMDSPSKGKVSVFNALNEDGSVHLYWEKVEANKKE